MHNRREDDTARHTIYEPRTEQDEQWDKEGDCKMLARKKKKKKKKKPRLKTAVAARRDLSGRAQLALLVGDTRPVHRVIVLTAGLERGVVLRPRVERPRREIVPPLERLRPEDAVPE